MAPFMFLFIFLSEASSGVNVLPVHPGDDATLPCQADGSPIRVVEWIRPDLKPYTVLLYIHGILESAPQNPSFKDRVELVDRDLKDGDVSLILKNVNINDAGTYKCGVKTGDTNIDPNNDPIRPIRTIHLRITEPDSKDGNSPVGLIVALTVVTLLLLPVAVVAVVVVWKRQRQRRDEKRTVVMEVPVRLGDDVILPCQAADPSISDVEWSRADLKPESILSYRVEGSVLTNLHPDYKEDKVELEDKDLKKGNMSLILKNVSRDDQGTYKCRVTSGGSMRTNTTVLPWETIRIIRLQVREPAVVMEVPVRLGDDVILPCQADDPSICDVEWSRADLKPDTILSYRVEGSVPTNLHPKYKEDKVQLVDKDLKKGNMSLILKNVSTTDQGTYKCRVTSGGSMRTNTTVLPWKTITIIRLQVREPAVVMEVPVHPGDDVILPCQADDPSICDVEWSRADLKPESILSYRVEGSVPTNLHPKYKEDKVQLVDKDLKKGNMSLILKNVSTTDQGTYKCRVTSGGSMRTNTTVLPWKTITFIRLQVREPAVVMEVPVHPGDDVILPCQADDPSICDVEWSRADLKPDTILSYRVEGSVLTILHPKYKEDKVELVEKDLKKGNMSLVLKNVSTTDQGTYKCRVTSGGSMRTNTTVLPWKTITIIRLQVTEPAVVMEVPVHPGDDVILPCQTDDPSICDVEWSRADLKSDTILSYRVEGLVLINLHPKYKEDKVELVDKDRKKGNMSLILRKVTRDDEGTYKCRVTSGGSMRTNTTVLPWKTITIIHLQVREPAVVMEVPVRLGDDVILPCQAADPSICHVEWTRADLKPDTILSYRVEGLVLTILHPKYKEDKVELVEKDLKKGNMSLVLKNVSTTDQGTYKCRVTSGGSMGTNTTVLLWKTITFIPLQVREPAGE
ncbi:immunoglobulin superfamily member 10-like isoform X4 [Perca fluviatilis]|uniref:immunoglobulin superfamily member 10-like isoform X4 n=1 Tax=Perca fluviatilis TaxID=8168 RepID=UPI0019634E44|nr:immunoglobulin superfamily member 10-like isoform X4 [Perca fluviatilis]